MTRLLAFLRSPTTPWHPRLLPDGSGEWVRYRIRIERETKPMTEDEAQEALEGWAIR